MSPRRTIPGEDGDVQAPDLSTPDSDEPVPWAGTPVDQSDTPAETDPFGVTGRPPEGIHFDETPGLPPAPGFVRIYHDELAATADVGADALDIYRSRGWRPIDEPAPTDPTPDDGSSSSDNPPED